mgnify:CR=1 FL=1
MPLYNITCAICAVVFSHIGYRTRRFCDDCDARREVELAALRSAKAYAKSKLRLDHLERRRIAQARWRAQNLSKEKANRIASHIRHRDERNAISREKYRSHREERNTQSKAYYRSHRSAILLQVKDWRDRNREMSRASNRKAWHKRRAILRGLPMEEIDIKALIVRDRGLCGICHKSIRPGSETIDHIIPVSLHGPHIQTNLQIAHGSCNKSRGAGRLPVQLRIL